LTFTIIAWRVLKSLRNDRRTLAFILIAPIAVMLVFGFAFQGELRDARIIVVSENQSIDSSLIIKHINPETFNIEFYNGNKEGALEEVRSGKAWMAIVIPKKFYEDLAVGRAVLEVYVDRSNVMVADRLLAQLAQDIAKVYVDLGFRPPLQVNITYVYGGEAGFMDAFMPGVLSIVIFFLSTLITLLSIVVERRTYTLYRLYATPISELDIVLGYSLAFSLIAALQVVELFAIGILLFDIKIKGNPLIAIVVGSLLAICGVNLGLLLSSIVRTEAQAPQVVPLVLLPSLLLSGVFWPVEAIPSFVRPLSYLIPPTYAVNAIRSIVTRGWGLQDVATDILALVVFATLFIVLGSLALRRRS